MEQIILKKMYLRNFVAAIAAVILCAAMTIVTHEIQNLVFIPLVVIGIGYSTWNLQDSVNKNQIMSVYAGCISMEDATVSSKIKREVIYGFSVKTKESEENSEMLFYIRKAKGSFYPGQMYCLLFKKTPDHTLSEKTLIGFEQVYQEAVSFDVSDTEDM